MNLFSISTFILLYITVVYGQAVNIPITVSNNEGVTSDIYFGLDLAATDGIDEALGEAELPGAPPGGYFAAWLLPDYTTMSYNDYRAPGSPPAFPFTGHVSYIIKIQNDLTANPMTVSWDLPSTIAATSTIGAGADIVSFSATGNHSWNYNAVSLQFIFVEVDFVGHTTGTEEEIGLPGNYELAQNYPNPFNPNTKIQFQVPKPSNVNLIIYNMLGQEITTLFAGEVEKGVHTVEWDGLNNSGVRMSSGTYIYRISAGDFVDSKEMILMK